MPTEPEKIDAGVPPGAAVWPTGEVELPRFFVLDEHEFTDSKIGEKVVLDRERLEHIAARCNSRRSRTGDLVPICLGHTRDDAPEQEQPPIVGFAVDFRVEPFFDTGKYALSATPVAKSAAHVRYFRENPRRSVELWLSPDDIDPIALLGSTTPRRDLGIHRFSRPHSGHSLANHTYSISEPKAMPLYPVNPASPPMGDSSTPPMGGRDGAPDNAQLAATVMQLPIMKQLEEILPVLMGMLNQGGDGPGGNARPMEPPEGELPEGEMDQSRGEEADEADETEGDEPDGDEGDEEPEPDEKEEADGDEEEEDEDEDGGPAKKYSSHAGPNNVGFPGSAKRKKFSRAADPRTREILEYYARRYGYDLESPRPAAAKFSRNESRSAMVEEEILKSKVEQERKAKVKFQKEVQELKQQVKKLQQREQIAVVREELKELDELGVQYSPEIEIPRLVKMSRESRAKHIDYIKQIASTSRPKLPVNPVAPESQASVKFSRTGGAASEESRTGPRTAEEAYEMANQVARGEVTMADVMAATGGKAHTPPIKVR